MELRSRKVKNKKSENSNQEPEEASKTPPTSRFRVHWDLIFWMIASFATLYLSEFASHILFNDIIKQSWLFASLLFLCVAVGCMVFAFKKHTGLDHTNWNTEAPVPVAVATATGISGGVCLTVAVWPVWKFLTLVILPVLFMGFLSIISLFNL